MKIAIPSGLVLPRISWRSPGAIANPDQLAHSLTDVIEISRVLRFEGRFAAFPSMVSSQPCASEGKKVDNYVGISNTLLRGYHESWSSDFLGPRKIPSIFLRKPS
jgi:hypothetical protein